MAKQKTKKEEEKVNSIEIPIQEEVKEKKKPGRKKAVEEVKKEEKVSKETKLPKIEESKVEPEVITVNITENSGISVSPTTSDVVIENSTVTIQNQEVPITYTASQELSDQAKKWLAYLNYTKVSPEQFITKYPTHKFITFIKEIIAFNEAQMKNKTEE